MLKEEELLIRKAQRGNIRAFEELVKKYDEKIMRLLLNMLNDEDDARDTYQEIFLKVYQSIGNYRFQSKFYTWLYRIAVNTSINYRKKRTVNSSDSLDEILSDDKGTLLEVIQDDNQTPEQFVLNIELTEKINQSIEKLSPRQRAVFILRHYHGHKLSEIAEILNCSEGTVKNYMFRSLQKMRDNLREYQQL